ncbi:semaphorin-6D-like [Aplochiton taeniatus]
MLAGFEQDIEGDHLLYSESCHADVLATTRNQNSAADSDSAYGVRRLPDTDRSSSTASVHYTLLIACILVAFLLGAILSGFLVSCYCSHSSAQRARRSGKDPEVSLPHALSLRSLAKLNGLLDGQPKDEKLDISTPKMYSSFIPNGRGELHLHTPGGHQVALSSLVDPDLSLSQGEGDLSGLPTPDSTPELPIKNMKAFRNNQWERSHNSNSQWERNQNCNNAKDSKSGSTPAFMAVMGGSLTQQVFPFGHQGNNSLSNGHHGGGVLSSSASLHLPEERKILSEERASSSQLHHPLPCPLHLPQPPQQPPQLPCSLPQAVVDVSALDELLKHIHEVSASGHGGITVLTSSSSASSCSTSSSSAAAHLPGSLANQGAGYSGRTHHHHGNHNSHRHNNHQQQHQHQQIPETECAAYYSSSTLPRDSLARRLDMPPEAIASSSSSSSCSSSKNHQQTIPERPGAVTVTRHQSQRHSLIKMGSSGGAVPRHHSFNHRGAPIPQHILARMNTNSSSNGGLSGALSGAGPQRPLLANASLTRQHSYSEPAHGQRSAVVRRTASLKPQVPPKPLFLPSAPPSTSPTQCDY